MLPPLLLCLTLVFGALAQDKQPTPVIAGRVVYEDTGEPATRHRVQLIAAEALLNARGGLRIPTTITDERGEFSLRSVSSGEYYVVAGPIDHRGANQLTSVLTRSADPAADAARVEQFKKNNLKINVDGQHNVDVNLRVPNPHFGTISGTVFDSTHQPVNRARVHVMGKDKDSVGGSMLTDDQGRYKFRGLTKGEYIVSASPAGKDTGERRDFQGTAGATYFPSTLLLQDSPPVNVMPDLDAGNIDVTLLARALHTVSGTIRMRSDTRPVTNATLRLSVRQITDPAFDTSKAAGVENPFSNSLSFTDKSGHWSFANVPDGSYRLFVQPTAAQPALPRFVQVEQDVRVDGADIGELLIEVSEGARISGSIVVEGSGTSPQFIDVTAVNLKLHANSGKRLEAFEKFELTGVPTGDVIVRAFVAPQDKFYVKSIEVNGVDLMHNNLTVADKDDIKDVRIVITARPAPKP